MSFEALDARTGEPVYIHQFLPDPKSALAGRALVCPVCRRDMVIRNAFVRNGHRVRPHFLHRLGAPDHPWTFAESPAHLAAKAALIRWLRRDFFWRDAAFVQSETPVRTRRRTDVMVTLPDGSRIAHEIQLSPLSRDTFLRRTHDYLAAGIPVFWWFDAARLNYAFRRTPVQRLQTARLALQFDYGDGYAANRHDDFPRRVTFAVAIDNPGAAPTMFQLAPDRPLPAAAARRLWAAMLWAPLLRRLSPETPQTAAELHVRLADFWRARFTVADVRRLLERGQTYGLVYQPAARRWLRLTAESAAFLHPLFTFTDNIPAAPAAAPAPTAPACAYPATRPLWHILRDTLAATDAWLTADGILDRLPAADRAAAEKIARTRHTPLAELARIALLVRWQTGDVLAGPGFTWRLQYLPDFDPADWQAALAHFSPDDNTPDPWYDFSARYYHR